MRKFLACTALSLLPTLGFAQNPPKIAVTDFAIKQEVREYFSVFSATSHSSVSASGKEREREGANGSYSASSSGRYEAKNDSSVYASSGERLTINIQELRNFTSDIRGGMLKSGSYRLQQGKPWLQKNTEQIYDIIERIKKGYYPGADYVLFGAVSSLQWRDEATPLKGTDTTSSIYSLELVVEFNLINTKTYEIKAAFSAIGEGNDTRLVQPGMRVSHSRGKMVSTVSKSLAEDVVRQLEEQFNPAASTRAHSSRSTSTTIEKTERVITYK